MGFMVHAERYLCICSRGRNCEIHCNVIISGKDGVAGMCGFNFPDEEIFADQTNLPSVQNGVLKMVEIVSTYPEKVTIVATGAQTNLAMAIRLFPTVKDNISKIVFMGGAIGLGNTGVAAEFNMEIDPEAAHVVFHSGIITLHKFNDLNFACC